MIKHFVSIIVFISLFLGSCTSYEDKTPNPAFLNASLQAGYDIDKNETPPGFDYDFVEKSQGVYHVVPGFALLYDDVFNVPEFASSVCNGFMEAENNPVEMQHIAFRLLSSSAGGFGPPLAGVKSPAYINVNQENFEDTFNKIREELDIAFRDFVSEDQWNNLPLQFKIQVLKAIHTLHISNKVVNQFIQPVADYLHLTRTDKRDRCYHLLNQPWVQNQLTDFSSIDAIEKADLRKLSFASRLISEQINELQKISTDAVPGDFKRCVMESSFGTIGLYGSGDDTIKGEYALLINISGNDHYIGDFASSSAALPVAVLIDYEGNDYYNAENGFLAAGIMGIGALIDFEGDDTYYCRKPGLASALYGYSILFDQSGDDQYIGKSDCSLASSRVGVAMLIDGSGNDEYNSKNYSQGFGSTKGIGVLIDFSGENKFNADIEEKEWPSFVLGASKGRWAEATDGHSLGGGFGIFIGGKDKDVYYSRSFSQGAAYYFGTGIFFDPSGNDHYNALTHSQGYGVHFALGLSTDKKGDDHFNAESDKDKLTQILGGGRDFSAGWFIDEEGNDEYHFGNRSAGIGDMNGLGVLWDKKGDDRYTWYKNGIYSKSESMGKVFKPNKKMQTAERFYLQSNALSHGVFIDNQGLVIEELNAPRLQNLNLNNKNAMKATSSI